MIIDSLRNYFRTCPILDTFNNVININYLDSNVDSYSIEETPTEPILKTYVNGDSIRQFAFVFTSREPYGVDILQNIENSGFYENFSNWIEDNNKNNIFPILESGLESLKIEILSTGYAFAVTEDTAQYQIQLKLKYFKKG